MTASNEPGGTRPAEADDASAAGGRVTGDRAMGARPAGSAAHAAESGPPTVRITESGDPPPWQRGAARAQTGGSRAAGERPAERPAGERPSGRTPAHAAPTPPNHAVSGTSSEIASARETAGARDAGASRDTRESQPADTTPEAPAHAEQKGHAEQKSYASELPDLSDPRPKSAPRSTTGDRESTGNGSATRSPARVTVAGRGRSGPVRASMQIRHIDPWSTLKVSGLLSVALFFVWMISVAILYLVLGGMGVWSKLNSNVGDLLTNAGGTGGELVSAGTIFGGALLIGLVNTVLFTALATLGAMVYNISTDIVGGVEVTLADRD
ncbi:hypothetical protein MINS_05350 [Mycolicibacterium insubricum]|uniref:Uncharacterized protein n=1 Tax=Mycolicibacterium insubricum TaxID=444597 RepID=A0A1X0DGZ6_9MYCO|nr:DUF3566 domain-containing protein [Mycolicibacterium insubricum]ORA71661.1 hypothetical protein BST26_07735 [Mycolicibacterium insubricum]BBZ65106.1 hypothetical protein MINS_05350 [Mycolicibacterium insubricum]